MEKVWITGHKNPDTDSICSAIAYAALKNSCGDVKFAYEPIRLGEINSETKFVLDYFSVQEPMLKAAVEAGERVIQVDHNEVEQAITGIETANIVGIIDHHRVNGIFTDEPIYIRIEPVGCTATIIAKLFKEKNYPINKTMAGLLTSAILSDSLIFRSPTCTAEDEAVCRSLAKIANISNLEAYGLEMLKAGSTLVGKSAETIFMADFKEFTVNDNLFGIGQINCMDIEGFTTPAKASVLKFMENKLTEKNYRFLFLAVTDIIKDINCRCWRCTVVRRNIHGYFYR